jgi:hypothetical protein
VPRVTDPTGRAEFTEASAAAVHLVLGGLGDRA